MKVCGLFACTAFRIRESTPGPGCSAIIVLAKKGAAVGAVHVALLPHHTHDASEPGTESVGAGPYCVAQRRKLVDGWACSECVGNLVVMEVAGRALAAGGRQSGPGDDRGH